ncbi:MAG: hypothetical protein JWM11_5408 [Planctomycetaceae bacterium]|nr:hypothetical protein [Planctomycetaceae bacterium]
MSKAKLLCDVFISHSSQDKQLAAEIAEVFRANDLQVFTNAEIPSGDKIEDAIWDAMAESQALVIVLSNAELSAWMMIEIGAAKAWNKPMYGIVSDPSSVKVPAILHDLPLYTRSRLDEVAQEIIRSSESLSEIETKILIEVFHLIAIPADQLALQPSQLLKLKKEFEKRSGRQTTGEQLLRMLIRLRKKGTLPRLTKPRPLPRAS